MQVWLSRFFPLFSFKRLSASNWNGLAASGAGALLLSLLLLCPSTLLAQQPQAKPAKAKASAKEFQNDNGTDFSAEIEILESQRKSGRIAFTYTKDGQADIYVLDFSQLSIAPLVRTKALDEYPAWSPDGQTLAFYSEVSGDREIHSIRADGSEFKRLTSSAGMDEDPGWSPDGTKIVFHSARGGKGSDLFIMNADGSNQTSLGITKKRDVNVNTVPKWSPRGTEIVYSTNEFWPGWDLMLYDTQTKQSKLLSSGFLSFCRAGWHPDGGSFVYSHGGRNSIDLWNFEKGGSKLEKLFERSGRDYDALWLEDGKTILFAGELEPGKGDFQLFFWNKDDNSVKQITKAPGALRFPSWTPFPTLAALEARVRAEGIKQ